MPLGPSLTRGTFARPGDPLLIRTKNENPVMFILSLGGGARDRGKRIRPP